MRLLSLLTMIIFSVYYLNCNESSSGEEKSGINNMLFPDLNIGIPISGRIILANETRREQYKIDPFTIDEAEITGDSIHFWITYSGGCKNHDFSLYAISYFMESYPVQAALLLTHDSNDDGCEALITKRKISFDLTLLRNEYAKFYRGNEGTIILKIYSDQESEKPLKLIYQ